jgi:pimeloyl-ACP methyl ester carboxylesterase
MRAFWLMLMMIGISICAAFGDDGDKLLRVNHYVRVRSTVPSIAGQTTQIYVREVVRAGTALRDGALLDRVVLFVHGAGTPGEVAFDVPYQDYSWMAYLARAGYDVFEMDMTGYGRSTRPPAMNDPCNLANPQQLTFTPGLLSAPCSPAYGQHMTTIASDWNDIGTVVDHFAGDPARGAGEPDWLVAGRSASRRIRGAAYGESQEARFASPRVWA